MAVMIQVKILWVVTPCSVLTQQDRNFNRNHLPVHILE